MTQSTSNAARAALSASLQARVPTWEVAQHILHLDVQLPAALQQELSSLAEAVSWSYGQMHDDFDRVDPADTQVQTLQELFPQLEVPKTATTDAAVLRNLARQALPAQFQSYQTAEQALIHVTKVGSSVKKQLRFLRRLEQKAARLADMQRLRKAQMQAKSRLAHEIDAAQCDDLTLAFCAYLAARANRRSIFMLGEQSRAQDTISSGLEELLKLSDQTNWSQVALVKPTKGVIERLQPQQRGELIGHFHAALKDSAQALSDLYPSLPVRMRKEMVMVKGVDSSRWNAYAGSLNTMRSAWISAVLAADLPEILDAYLPGKAPRLMASDLVHMYRYSGQPLHEDTRMFNRLPYPWQVIQGEAQLSTQQVLEAARQEEVDAQATGWVGPRAFQEREKAQAEPALVHGVVVADPQLAQTLRRCGAFSSKKLKHTEDLPDALLMGVKRDETSLTPEVLGALQVEAFDQPS